MCEVSEEHPCGSITLAIEGDESHTFLVTDLPLTFVVSNGRKITVSSLGGGEYAVEYDVTSARIGQFKRIEGTLTINGGGVVSDLDTTFPGVTGLETFPGPLGGDDADIVSDTLISFSLRTLRASKDTFSFMYTQTDSDEDGVADCSDLCEESSGPVDETGCPVILCVPTPEVCDGLDNDCDEAVDEDITPIVQDCGAGVGACFAAGTITTSCVAGAMTAGECTAIA